MSYAIIGIIAVLSFIAGILLTSVLIPILIHRQAGQNIREEGPEGHKAKAGTPSMGGLAIIAATLGGLAVGGYLTRDTILIVGSFVLFGAMGFLDDYLKVVKKQNEGLKAWQKLVLQVVLGLGIALYMVHATPMGSQVYLPILDQYRDFGFFYIPFIVFTVVAMANAVNLTDGLDGLAAGTTAIVSLFLAFVGVTNQVQASAGFFSALMGACLGFLVYNRHPARVFMGDTGSLALGGGITAAAVVMKMELILPVVGLVYVLEALSVCLQVIYFKATKGKRLFKMAPLHHHFELSGLHESKVVLIFWLLTLLCCVIGLVII